MERACNNFVLALLMLQTAMTCFSQEETTIIATDQSALLALKAQITSDPHQFLSNNWSVASPVCEWIGVTCDPDHQRVSVLNISNMGLTGTIPQLGNLSFLVQLDLTNNSFYGNFPHDLVRLQKLRVLHCSYNDLSGELPGWLGSLSEIRELSFMSNAFSGLIPPSISNLSKLEILYLSYNSLEGMLPAGFGNLKNLRMLAIQYNKLTGSFPVEIYNISALEINALSGNSLSGSLPNNFCHFFQRLELLYLHRNEFIGEIPMDLSPCTKLQVLDLSYNRFSGLLPKEIGNLVNLQDLRVQNNEFRGEIPREISNLTMLKILLLGPNNFTGSVPWEISNLYNLQELYIENTSLSGSVPVEIFNHTMLRIIQISDNSLLSGRLPASLGFGLPNLEELYLPDNGFSGVIPRSISNCSKLKAVEISRNNFTGYIPESFGELNHLEYLSLFGNILRNGSPSQELNFLTSLTKCKSLKVLRMSDNPISGFLPASIGNLSNSIAKFTALNCYIQGSIPNEIGNLSSLVLLDLSGNQLTGSIPTTIEGLKNIQGLFLHSNELSGTLLDNFCGIQGLSYLSLSNNKIMGQLPNCLGNITSLRYLRLGSNRLNSSIPANIWNLKDLLELNLSSNFLTGSVPTEVGYLKVAAKIDLSMNCFSSDFPSTIGSLQNLVYLSVAHNKFQGPIPESVSRISSLEILDLSHNNFSGLIPRSLEMLRYLEYLDVSSNHLRGEIPSSGPFLNFSGESFAFNEALCGAPRFSTPPCQPISSRRILRKSNRNKILFLLFIISAIAGGMAIGLPSLRNQMETKVSTRTDLLSVKTHERISYFELLQATNRFDEGNFLGIGSFGSVYKGTLNDGRVVAVKVFNFQEEGVLRSFEAECQVFSCLRHRNLTKVINNCSNMEFKALVLEFMPNGSLEKWLYSHNHFLDTIQRLNIMIDVACALYYLHSCYLAPVVHLDLKPSNVLLDQEMVAHVSDFGISKLLDQGNSITRTKTLATLGYLAPEHGLAGLVSTKCDIYSYGIILIEVFTRTKPSNVPSGENMSLRDWVSDSMPNSFAQIIDPNLLNASEDHYNEKLKCLSSIFQVALICSTESPRDRWNISEVLQALKQIKLQLLSYYR